MHVRYGNHLPAHIRSNLPAVYFPISICTKANLQPFAPYCGTCAAGTRGTGAATGSGATQGGWTSSRPKVCREAGGYARCDSWSVSPRSRQFHPPMEDLPVQKLLVHECVEFRAVVVNLLTAHSLLHFLSSPSNSSNRRFNSSTDNSRSRTNMSGFHNLI